MPLSRAEIQRRYRERKKNEAGEAFLLKERKRRQKYYKPVSELSVSERKKRNEDINKRVRKHRLAQKLIKEQEEQRNRVDETTNPSTSGYSSQETDFGRLIVKIPSRRNGPKRRVAKALSETKAKLKQLKQENVLAKRKVKTLQKKLQRLSKQKPDLTPRRKTDMFLKLNRIKNDNVRKQLLFGNIIVRHMRDQAKHLDRNMRNRIYHSAASGVIKKYKCITRVSRELQINRHKLARAIKQGVDFKKIKRRRKIAQMTDNVERFLEREDNSRAQPGKKDAKNTSDGKRQTHILTDYMANLHQKYLAENPESKLSLATFCRMRPKHVLLSSCLSRNVCLCTKHQNMALKLQMMKKVGIDVPQNPETFVQNGAHIDKDMLPENVVYMRWKRVTLENQKKKMKIVSETQERDAFYEEWMKEVSVFETNYAIMRNQYKQTRVLKEALPNNEIVIHMDFAENYSCKTADEIQSAYWNATQVTLHPMVIYFRDNEGKLQHKSYVAVSDTMSHSAGTVLAIIEKLFTSIDLPECSEIQYVHYWTDSPTSQYRNRYIFDTILNHEERFGCPATWNYYESGHGKNVCDGLGGTVKRLADEAVRSGKCTIQDADDFMKWASESNMKGVTFLFVNKEECEVKSHSLQQVEMAPIKGTLQLHAVRLDPNGSLCTRNMSCYCEICVSGQICESWNVIRVERKNANKTENEIASIPTSTYETGDYIAVLYEENWYIGQILEIDDDIEGYEYNVNFMQKRKGLFQWPSKEDSVWRKKSQIICKVNPPVASGKSKRMYRLGKTDEDMIEELIQNTM